jgi:PAS domain S-box-containing protein
MENFLKIPDFRNEELNTRARTIVYTSIGIILLSLIFIATIPFYAPEFTNRYIRITGAIAATCLSSILLVQRGKLQIGGLLLIILLWLVVTTSTITAGSVSAPILAGFMIIILLGGLVLSFETGVITTLACIITGIAIALAETAGLLRDPISFSPAIRIGAYVFIFLVVMTFQTVNTIFIAELIKKSKRSESRYQSLLENIPATTYINSLDTDAKTEYISPQVENLLGYPPNSFTEDPLLWTKILHPEDRQMVLAESERTSDTQENFKMEYRVIAKDKQTVWLKDEAALIHDTENGAPLYWLGVWTDITYRKQVEDQQLDLVHGMARRTIQLQTAAEVASAATSILDIDELLPNVVELFRNHFE